MFTASELRSTPDPAYDLTDDLKDPARAVPRARTSGMEAVILAGGKGLRLRPYTTLIPKPLVPIGDEHSVLEVVMRQLAAQGFARATLTIGYLGQLVQAYAGDGSQWGIEINYLNEDSPLGTMGPVLRALDDLPEHFVVVNADVLTSLDFADMLDSHVRSGAALTVATRSQEHRVEYGVLDIRDRRIRGFEEKPTMTYLVNMGIYAVSRNALTRYSPGLPYGFDELISDLIEAGEYPAMYEFDGCWVDIGRPADYDRANQDFDVLIKELLPRG